MDYLVAVATMGAAVLVFLGYESFQSAKDNVKSEIDSELITVRDDIKKTEDILRTLKIFSDSIKQGVSVAGSQAYDQMQILSRLERKIETINSKNIVKQGYYVVRGLKLAPNHETVPGSNRVYFENLVTDIGDRLPQFTKSPLIIPIMEGEVEVGIINISENSFDAWYGNAWGTSDRIFLDTIKYSIVIIGK
jgi:hypothetical protein